MDYRYYSRYRSFAIPSPTVRIRNFAYMLDQCTELLDSHGVEKDSSPDC